MSAVIVVSAVFVNLGLLWLHARSNIRLAERHKAGQEARTTEAFGQRYFSGAQARIAARIRDLLAEETVVRLDCLTGGNDFSQVRPILDRARRGLTFRVRPR